MRITFVALLVIIAACLFAGVVLDRAFMQPEHRQLSEREDTTYTYQQRAVTTHLPPSEYSGAITGTSVNAKPVKVQRVHSGLSAAEAVSDAPLFIIDSLTVYVPRSDTGIRRLTDTVILKREGDSIKIKIHFAPVIVSVQDTVIFVHDSVTLRDSLVIRERPQFALEIKTGIKYPGASIGSILAYGAEFSYAVKRWIYSLEPFVQNTHAGVAMWLKYVLF